MSDSIRIASVNVNGVRAAVRKGMDGWLADSGVTVLALQEVRAERAHLEAALPGWEIVNAESLAKGRSGVALLTTRPVESVRTEIGEDGVDSAGRWIEAQLRFGKETLTVASAYVHSGEVDTPKQEAKYGFLDAMEQRMRELSADSPLSLIMGDLNVGHREIDIRNWKGNRKKAGFLPQERAYFDRFLGSAGQSVSCVDGSTGEGLGWVDVGRAHHGEVEGPYTWWSMRGRAFDTDTGWRIDYHLATPALAERAQNYSVARASSWDSRWSDHAPVVVDYELGR